MYKVEHYLPEEGRDPFQDWLDALRDRHGKAKILARLDRLEAGNPGDCAPVGEGVSELRVDSGPGYRVYFGYAGDRLMLLLCGGDKGSQKKDIKKAITYWKDYKGRQP